MRIGSTLRAAILLTIATVTALLHSDSLAADRIEIPGGFRLGSTLEEAKLHAATRGWQLVNMPPLSPNFWFAHEANIGLSVCNNIVAGVIQESKGDIDDFVRFVFDLQVARGKPEYQVVYLPYGPILISNIDARFSEVDGVSIAVQLSSTSGRLTMSANYYSDICTDRRSE